MLQGRSVQIINLETNAIAYIMNSICAFSEIWKLTSNDSTKTENFVVLHVPSLLLVRFPLLIYFEQKTHQATVDEAGAILNYPTT